MISRRFHENGSRGNGREIDYLGAILLTTGLTLLILGVVEGGQAWAWLSAPGIVVLGCGAALLTAFVVVETRESDPVLPLWVFRRRLLITCSLVSFGVGAILLGLSSYIPTFVWDVLGTGPLVAGFALVDAHDGVADIGVAGRTGLFLRFGVRACALVGQRVRGLRARCCCCSSTQSTSVVQVGLDSVL